MNKLVKKMPNINVKCSLNCSIRDEVSDAEADAFASQILYVEQLLKDGIVEDVIGKTPISKAEVTHLEVYFD